LAGPTLMARFVPAAPPDQRPAVARALGARLGRWRLVQVGSIAVVAGVLVAVVPERFDALVTGLVVAALALDVAATLAFQVALGFGRAGVWSARFPLQNTLLLGAVLGLYAVAGRAGSVAGIAVASAGALAFAASVVAGPLRRAAPGAPLPAGALRFGLLGGASVALVLLQQRGGVVAVALLGGTSAEAGYAALALGVAIAGTAVVWQLFAVQLPGLIERGATGLGEAERAARRLAWQSLAVLLPGALLAAALLTPGIRLVLGDRFLAAHDAFAAALAVLPLAPLTGLATQASALRLRPELRLWATAAGASVFLVTVAVAVPLLDAAAAPAALLTGSAVTVIVAARLLGAAPERNLTAVALAGVVAVLVVASIA
ncbi:MAG TPA: hypothetical protein VGJ32_09805, partial [Solirubrobacteraceae bacterium]